MTQDEIRALLNDLESDRVERTISTTNTDKFGQAICAFANDLPDHRMPGYYGHMVCLSSHQAEPQSQVFVARGQFGCE